MPITEAEMDKIAEKVMSRLERRLIRSNFVQTDQAGKVVGEQARDANVFDTTGSANTNSSRLYLGKGVA